LGAAAEEEVAMLVGETGLLRAAAVRPDGLDEERVVQIATFLETRGRATALYLLSVALGALEPWERTRLDALHDMVQDLLARPDLVGREARNLAEQRRAAAVRRAGTPAAAERLVHASRAYLLSQDPAALARQARLLEPTPRRGQARVLVGAEGTALWRVEVASRDRRGLLAVVTGVLAATGLDVVDAAAATWPDGAAVESFLVSTDVPPDEAFLGAAVESALKGPLSSSPIPDAKVSFDDEASPWYTLCEVEAPDERGLLHALAVAFAASGADVHSARISTVQGRAVDRFELTDGRGAKLDDRTRGAISNAVTEGVRPRRGRRTKPARSRNNRVTDTKPPVPTVSRDSFRTT
jgi:[protein-PII] uridylyltransferase